MTRLVKVAGYTFLLAALFVASAAPMSWAGPPAPAPWDYAHGNRYHSDVTGDGTLDDVGIGLRSVDQADEAYIAGALTYLQGTPIDAPLGVDVNGDGTLDDGVATPSGWYSIPEYIPGATNEMGGTSIVSPSQSGWYWNNQASPMLVATRFTNNTPSNEASWDFWVDENDYSHQSDMEFFMFGFRLPQNLTSDGTTYLAGEVLLVRQNTYLNGVEPIGDGAIMAYSHGDLGGHVIGDITAAADTLVYESDCGGQFVDAGPFGFGEGEAVTELFVYNNAWSEMITVGWGDEWTLPFWIPAPDGTPDDFEGDGTPDTPLTQMKSHAWDHLNYDYNGDGTILNNIDPDGDGTLNIDTYGFVDTNGDGTADGVPDAWQVDVDGDGTLDIVRYLWTDNPLGGGHDLGGARTNFGDSTTSADRLYVHALWEVPEPATVLMVGGGVVAALRLARRRRRK